MNPFDLHNAVFLLSLGTGVFLMVITALGGIGDGSDHDHDAGHDSHDTDHDAMAARALSILGIGGRIPILLALTILLLLFGAIGFILNIIFASIGLPPRIYGWISLISAAATARALMHLVANAFVRALPKTESYGVTREELCGCRGVAVYNITEQQGMVQVRDARGNLQKVSARTKRGEKISMNSGVEILSYEDGGDYFIVTKIGESV